MLIALSLFSTVALSLAPLAPSTEVARLRAHFDVVLDELARADTAHLDDAQRMKRAHHIEVLRAYAREGRFPLNEGHADGETPIFVDDHGTRCAMGHLIAESGGGALVDEIRTTRNLAYIAELADDPRLHAWLDENGLTLREAGRIQPGYQIEQTMVTRLCSIRDTHADQSTSPHVAVVIVDVTSTKLLDTFPSWGGERDRFETRVVDVVAVMTACTEEPCVSRVRHLEGSLVPFNGHFAEKETRRGVMYVWGGEEDLNVMGLFLFNADEMYGDNLETDPWLRVAGVSPVWIPDAVMTKALLVETPEACLDALIAHDVKGVCQVGAHFGESWTEFIGIAKQKCEAALVTYPQSVDDDESGLGPDDEPNGTPAGEGCGGAPSLALGLFALGLRRRRALPSVRQVVRT